MLFWVFTLWMLNQYFVLESIEVNELNGLRQEVRTYDYRLFYSLAIGLLAKMIWVYGNIGRVIPKFLKEKSIRNSLVALAALGGFCWLLEWGLISLYVKFVPNDRMSVNYFTSMWQLNLLLYALFLGVAIAWVLGKNRIQDEKEKKRLEKEKMAAEIRFLKSQINPHFLFNTLNNLYAIAEKSRNQQLSDGLMELSSLMRYMLHDGQAEWVSVEQEIKLIRSLIEIQQLRIAEEDDVVISLNVSGDIENTRIAPLILIPFVENAFKHGIDWKQKSFVRINLGVENEIIRFEIRNSVFAGLASGHEQNSGIGLDNVRRRLALIYPEAHTLEIEQQDQVYSVTLILPVKQ